MPFPILTYHSQIFRDNSYAGNDHVALRQDLERIHAGGRRVEPLSRLVDWLDGRVDTGQLAGAVFLTFDDGSDFDVRDIDHPEFGTQRSFLGILQDSAAGLDPDRAGSLHATTFVIASEEARRIMDARSLRGRGWIGSDWWAATDRGGRIAIESHGWDHNHPDLGGAGRGGFENIDTDTLCTQQVIRAAEAIGAVTGRPPVFFAYPYGQSSAYLRETWFPGFTGRHGCRAAFGTEPAHVSAEANRWNLPRYVCGRDWQTPDGLQAILDAA